MKPYYVLCAWGDLWDMGQYHEAAGDTDGLYCCAASAEGGAKAGILLTNMGDTARQAELRMEGLTPGQKVRFYLLEETSDMVLTRTEIFRGDTVIPVVQVPAKSVVYVTLEKE